MDVITYPCHNLSSTMWVKLTKVDNYNSIIEVEIWEIFQWPVFPCLTDFQPLTNIGYIEKERYGYILQHSK